MQSLGLQARLQQKLWSQERTLLVQESQHLKQTLLLLSLKLRCFLKQWRLGCKKDTEWKDILEVRVVNIRWCCLFICWSVFIPSAIEPSMLITLK